MMDFISQGRKNMGAREKCPNFEKCMGKTTFVPPLVEHQILPLP
jgi:hypothetical protein